MIEWIIAAELVDRKIKNQCRIVYEPDCASLSIQHQIRETKQHTMGDDSGIDADFCNGEKYLLIDAGGGTVDVACHEILGEFAVKEIIPPSGGPWGSCYIDDQYKQTLNQIFGDELMKEFRKLHPDIFVEMMDEFQIAKGTYTYNQKSKHHGCRIPDDFMAWIDEKFEDNQDVDGAEDIVTNSVMFKSNLVRMNEESLEFDNIVWISMFDQVIDPIIEHIKKLLDNTTLMRNCKYLCLVGGMSCSPYFQSKMKEIFGIQSEYKLQVIIPKSPILSVVEGAAYFAIKKDYIKGRVLQRTYGYIVAMPQWLAKDARIPQKHIQQHTYYHKWKEEQYVANCFRVLAHKNKQILYGDIITDTSDRGKPTRMSITIRIYSSILEKPLIKSDGTELGLIHLEWNNTDINDMEMIIEFNFYDTTIEVYTYKKIAPNNKQKVNIEYKR